MRPIKIGSVAYMGELLTHYQRHGHWTKEYIQYRQESGNFLKSVSVWPDSIRVKLKRNVFIVFHSDQYIYLVDSMKIVDPQAVKEMVTIKTNGIEAKGVRLMPWNCNPNFLDRLEKLLLFPEKLFTMALNRLSPLIVAKVKQGRSLVRDNDGNPVTLVRKSEIGMLANNGLVIKELTNAVDRVVMKTKSK